MNAMAHEGEKVRWELDRIGKKPADLARACGVSRTAVDHYMKAAKIGKHSWTTLRAGLVKLGIDPFKIKADDVIVESDEDLRPYVQGFSREELENIKRVLEADQAARERLLYYLDGVLFQPKK